MGRRSWSRWSRREGVGSTWFANCTVKSNSGDTVVGGEVETGFTAKVPDRYKLCH